MAETGGNSGGGSGGDSQFPVDLDTETTLSNGKCRLESDVALTSGAHYFLIRNGDTIMGEELDAYWIYPHVVSGLDITGLNMVSKGYQIPISINADISDLDLSDYEVKVTGAITGTYKTDQYGKVQLNYKGVGAGDTSITASIGNQTVTYPIEDLLMYWNAARGSQNLQYFDLEGTFVAQNVGFAFSTSQEGLGVIGLFDGSRSNYPPNYSISFDVLSSSPNLAFGMTAWSSTQPLGANGWYDEDNLSFAKKFNMQAGDKVTIEYDGRGSEMEVSYYINDIAQYSAIINNSDYSPAMFVTGSGTLLFNNLKCKVL